MQVFKILGNFLLEWIATGLLVLVMPLNFLAELIGVIRKRGVIRAWSRESFNNAFSVDVFGNEHYATLWNLVFKRRGGYEFGKKGETISKAMAKNMKLGKLSIIGWIVAFFINVADVGKWGKGGHFKGITK